MKKLYEWRGYSRKPCEKCGRLRVERWYKKPKTTLHMCEKCHWCKETGEYVLDSEDGDSDDWRL